MSSKKNKNDNLTEEINIQKRRVMLYGAKTMATMMEVSNASVEELLNLLRDELLTSDVKVSLIKYAIDKVLPNVEGGMVKLDVEAELQRFLDEIKDGNI